mgnify:CR=1 FL=1
MLIKEKIWERVTILTIILIPFSILFAFVSAAHRFLCRKIRDNQKNVISVPVIIVGNLTVGGTGKTPLVIHLSQELLKVGLQPGILSRGYGRTSKKILEVGVKSSIPEVGDEPKMIFNRLNKCPIFVGDDKHQVALTLVKKYPKVQVLISDDGLQHYKLRRDVEICVVDGTRLFGNGYLLPAGPMRESISRLKSVDLVVVKNGSVINFENTPCFNMKLDGKYIHNLQNPKLIKPLSFLKDQDFDAVAGIGNPDHFFKLLEEQKLNFKTHRFPDHHLFSKDDFSFDNGEPLIMTEKDAIKCKKFANKNWWMLRVDAIIGDNFAEIVLNKIKNSHG